MIATVERIFSEELPVGNSENLNFRFSSFSSKEPVGILLEVSSDLKEIYSFKALSALIPEIVSNPAHPTRISPVEWPAEWLGESDSESLVMSPF